MENQKPSESAGSGINPTNLGKKPVSRQAPVGTEGIPTSISTLGPERNQLIYRGYNALDLAAHVSYEEVLYLILKEELPDAGQLQAFNAEIVKSRYLQPYLVKFLEIIPKHAHPQDVLRTIVSIMGILEHEREDFSNQYECAIRLIGMLGPAVIYWYHFSHSGIRIEVNPRKEDSIAFNFLSLLNQTSNLDPDMVRAFDIALILGADNSASSTLTARVTSSTRVDYHSSIVAAMTASKGVLHLGASAATIEYLKQVKSNTEADEFLKNKIEKKELIMGFGHPVYKKGDPRTDTFELWAKKITKNKNEHLFEIAKYIESKLKVEKNFLPNADFYLSIILHQCGLPNNMFVTGVALSRLGGFSAHIFEQRKLNRLLHQVYVYTGPSNRQVRQKL